MKTDDQILIDAMRQVDADLLLILEGCNAKAETIAEGIAKLALQRDALAAELKQERAFTFDLISAIERLHGKAAEVRDAVLKLIQ